MKTVFLSYSHDDSDVADKIGNILKGLDVSFFIDNKSIDLGTSITSEVRDAITNCRALIVVVSPASLKSHWVPYEIGHASALGKKVIPFLTHRALELPHYLSDLSNTTDLKQIHGYFEKYRNDIAINRRNTTTPVFDNLQTEKFIRLHQGLIAHLITRVIDGNLALIKKDRKAFKPDVFLDQIFAAILKGRALCGGFESESLGDLNRYFEQRLPDDKLREYVEPHIPDMLEVDDSLEKRSHLLDVVETIQEKVYASVIKDLHSRATKIGESGI